ncbi:MAG: MFS transporter [Gemmiger sp.]
MSGRVCTRLEHPAQGSRLFVLCWLAYASAYVGRYNYSAVMGCLLDEGALSLQAAGAVSTAYFGCYAVGQVLSGFLSGRLSPYRMIFAGLSLAGVCNLMMGVVPPAAMAAVWACNGVFQAMLWPPIVRLFAEAMPLCQQKNACVSINSTTPAGTLVSYAFSAAVLQFSRWNAVFRSCGILMLVVAAVWMVCTRDLRTASAPQPAPSAGRTARRPRGVFAVMAASGLFWAVVPVILHGSLKDGVTAWVPSLIQQSFSVSPAFSAAVTMVLPVVNLAGAYAAGWADRHVFRNEFKTAGALFALAALCLTLLPPAAEKTLAGTVLLLAVTTASMLGVNTLFIGVIPVRAGRAGGAAAISALLNAATYAGASLCSGVIGTAVEHTGWAVTFTLWLGMALTAGTVSLLCSRRWDRFCCKEDDI